jgi:hypothetical protein
MLTELPPVVPFWACWRSNPVSRRCTSQLRPGGNGGRLVSDAQPMINFSAHEVRAGKNGAREDFEQMLALLVQATHGEAALVSANPGDWGIDVLVGDLHGRIAIWQAKYFIREFNESQKGQVRKSFAAAIKAAGEHGYTVNRWALCIPWSLDPRQTQWWQGWKAARQRETGVIIDLWDETELRRLLLLPGAADVRRHYYNPYRRDAAADEPGQSLHASPVGTLLEPVWAGGAELRLAGSVYLLHDEPSERSSRDMSWVWREATADLIERSGGRVRLRQIEIVRPVAAAEHQHAGLQAQARLLTRLNGRPGLPHVLGTVAGKDRVTIVTAHPGGASWAEVFGPGRVPADRLTAARILSAAASVCAPLRALHKCGTSHRALYPGAIFIEGDRCSLRDAGLAEIPPATDEGEATYRAPEQFRAPYAAGAWTDVYQLAAIAYHTLTGHPPSPAASPPVRAALPGFPEHADQVLLAALDADPARRPASATALGSALRAGRAELSRAAHR